MSPGVLSLSMTRLATSFRTEYGVHTCNPELSSLWLNTPPPSTSCVTWSANLVADNEAAVRCQSGSLK